VIIPFFFKPLTSYNRQTQLVTFFLEFWKKGGERGKKNTLSLSAKMYFLNRSTNLMIMMMMMMILSVNTNNIKSRIVDDGGIVERVMASGRVIEYLNLLMLVLILFSILMFARSMDRMFWDVSSLRRNFDAFVQGFAEAKNELCEETSEEKGDEGKGD
jgi:hypothetical protein